METKDPAAINYAKYNPRVMSAYDAQSLEESMTKFGDIAGITSNTATNNYVTGHQRMKTLQKRFPGRVNITITERYMQPDQYGTTAIGYVGVNDTTLRFAYREVNWSEITEKIVNIAANRIEADWEREMLAELNAEIASLENGEALLKLTGQHEDELKKLAGEVGPDEPKAEKPETEANKLEFALTREQREIVEEAISYYAANRDMASERNSSINGNALYFMARETLDRLHNEPPIQ